jgi:hypothetical protein
MPLLRGAMIGGTAYAVGRRSASSGQREADQSTGQAGGTDVASRLSQLSTMLQQGMLTQDEFARAKAQLLGT